VWIVGGLFSVVGVLGCMLLIVLVLFGQLGDSTSVWV